jgi:septal ring factor EnvC (AmiA/AmiB activator)
MSEGRTFSEAEVEHLVAKRLKERQEIIAETVSALKPHLERMSDEIASANHIKQTLGRDINRLSREVRATNRQLTQHMALAGHPGTITEIGEIKEDLERSEELMHELGVNDLSADQRRVFPAVLKSYVMTGEEQQKADRRSARRQVWIHLATSFLSALVTAIVVVSGFIAWLASHHIRVGP